VKRYLYLHVNEIDALSAYFDGLEPQIVRLMLSSGTRSDDLKAARKVQEWACLLADTEGCFG
jgi:hypothetical protein